MSSCPFFTGKITLAFNTHRRESWIRQLPFSASSLLLVSLTIIGAASLWYFVTMGDTWREGYLHMGSTVVEFLFLLPFFNFFIIRRARQPILGAFIGALASFVFIFFHATILWQWNQAHYGLVAEVPYWIVLVAVCLLFEKESKRAALVVSAFAAAFPAMLALHASLSEPGSLKQVVADMKVYPTKAAVENFRAFATDGKYWKDEPGQHAIKWKVNRASQAFAKEFLMEEEVTAFLKNILGHAENFAILEPNRNLYSYSDPFPLERRSLGAAAKTYLVANWKDDEAYCYFLPRDIESDYLRLALASKTCARAVFDFFFDHPYPHLEPSKTVLLDEVLRTPRDKLPKEARDALGRLVNNNSSFPTEVDTMFAKNNWYKAEALTPEAVTLFKQYYLGKERQRISEWLVLGRQDFEKAILDATKAKEGPDRRKDGSYETYKTLKYLCLHVSKNCDGEVPEHVRSNLGFIMEKYWRNWSAKSASWSEHRYQIAQEILKPEYWDAIKQLKILEQ